MAAKRSADELENAQGETALQLLMTPDVDSLGQLKALSLSNLDLRSLPDSISHCKLLEKLDIGGNKNLGRIPEALTCLPELKILFASDIGLVELPHETLASCKQLRMLGVKDNALTSIDGSRLPESLVWLIAAGNKIKELPNIARLKRIRKLMLSNNELTCEALAPIAGIEDLEMIRVAENKLEAFPEALLTHRKLAWVAVGSNPFTDAVMEKRLRSMPEVLQFSDVHQEERLGSGAGATVYKATWQEKKVALKLWEGVRASDGTAQGEWAANCVAGDPGFPSLLQVHGVFKEPLGMVMELLDSAVQAASPPSFQTVTRDNLSSQGGKGPTYTAASGLAIAHAVAKASGYLRSKGIHHGDVYLHNTLVVLEGDNVKGASVRDVRLSDFGAAASIDEPTFSAFEKLEVRTFGWLLQDLLESLEPPAAPAQDSRPEVELLRQLRERCSKEIVAEIPTFKEICTFIEQRAKL